MENHPIPQDVTGFQFKLIGQMTVKQFAFVGSGVAMSYISYLSPLPFILRLILISIFAGTGCAMAFLPIDGRPLDAMLIHFFKAIFSPNQYIFEKVGGQFPAAAFPNKQAVASPQLDNKRLQSYLQALPTLPKNELDKKELAFFSMLNPQPIPTQPPPEKAQEEAPVPPGLPLEVPHVVAVPINPPRPIIAQPKSPAPAATAHFVPPPQEEKPHPIVAPAKEQTAADRTPGAKETSAEGKSKIEHQERKSTPSMRKIAQTLIPKTGLPRTPDVANLITGIIKDARGNVLPHILVEINDNEQNPVRAFKTNPLGQFASATPLPNGTYTISFEDTSGTQKFDAIAIDIAGDIIQPLEVFSIDEREELRKTLFSQ